VEVKNMPSPTVPIPLKNIFLLWSESSDQSRLNRPFAIWPEAEENESLRPGGAAWAARLLDGYELGGSS
jgi:hypothetical protein